MHTFENTVTIQRPSAQVFEFLAHFENIPMWNYAIEETRKASTGPVGVGTRYRQTRTVPTRSVEEFEIIVFEPTSRLAIHGELGPFEATIGYQMHPMADGTRLVNTVELDTSRPGLRLVAPLATTRIKAAVAQNLDKLRHVVESAR